MSELGRKEQKMATNEQCERKRESGMWKKNGGQGRQLNNNSNWNQDIKNSSIYHLKTIRSNIKIDAEW